MSIVNQTSVKYIYALDLCFCFTGVPPSKESLLIKENREQVFHRGHPCLTCGGSLLFTGLTFEEKARMGRAARC